MKLVIFTGITLGGILGGWLGSKLDGGFGLWSALLGFFIGPLAGLFIGYHLAKNYLE